jgi:purine-binding chemotaxis protein CheW
MPVRRIETALAHSRERHPDPVETQQNQYLVFTLGRETFAMDTRKVREVIQFEGLTEVPLLPACIRGVINLREAVVPVLDLGVRFGRGPSEAGRRTCIVVVELEHQDCRVELGILVDAVNEVLEIRADAIEPPPTFGSALDAELLAGVARVAGTFVILLDVDHVLTTETFQVVAGETTP